MLFKGYYESPIGNILITADNDVIHQISFIENIPDNIENDPINSLVDETRKQLSLYFSQKRQKFDLPVFTGQSDFAKEVFEEVRNIPFGQTITYSQLAMRLGSTRLTRAVASANAKNPTLLIVPCHRVVGKNNQLTGYSGKLWRKQWLLNHESNINSIF